MAGEGQPKREVTRVVASDLGVEQLIEEHLAA